MRFCIAIQALLLVAVSSALGSEAVRVGREIPLLVEGPGNGIQGTPSVAFGDGVYCVVWREGWQGDGGQARVFAARVKSNGEIIDRAGIQVAPSQSGIQAYPQVAFSSGVFLIVWQDLRNGEHYDILGARVSTQGNVLDSQPIAVARGDFTQALPDVASDGKGFLVVWQAFEPDKASYEGRGVRVGVDGSVGKAFDVGAPQPKVAWDGKDFLVVFGSTHLYSQKITNDSSVSAQKPVSRFHKISLFSLAAEPQEGWLVINHRSPPDHWGWGGPGAMRCYFVSANGELDPALEPVVKEDRAGNWSKLANWLDLGSQSDKRGTNPEATWPYGKSAVAWDGKQFIAVWPRHHIMRSVKYYNADLVVARVDRWRPQDPTPVTVAASPLDEGWPAVASDGEGSLLCVYEKNDPDGGVRIYGRILRTD